MRKSRFTEQQIAFALRQAEAGTKVSEVCRKIGVAEPTFYNWKKNITGIMIHIKTLLDYFWVRQYSYLSHM